MVTYTQPEIDWDTFPGSDGEPMAETVENAIQMVDLQFALRCLLETQGRARVAVGGNQLMYYNPRNGRDHISPDVYAALDVAPGLRPTWRTWDEGKFPDIVFEITSPSTEDVDRGSKLELYARLGAREYYIYDPQQAMVPPLRAYTRQGDALLPLALLPTGAVVSPLLGAELRPVGIYLRVVDPATGLPFRTAEEERRDRIAEERARIADQGRADAEEQARIAVEKRAELAEARGGGAARRPGQTGRAPTAHDVAARPLYSGIHDRGKGLTVNGQASGLWSEQRYLPPQIVRCAQRVVCRLPRALYWRHDAQQVCVVVMSRGIEMEERRDRIGVGRQV